MRGKVWEPKKSKYTGITKAAWFHATPGNYVGSSALDRLPPTRGYSNNKCLVKKAKEGARQDFSKKIVITTDNEVEEDSED